MSRRMTSETIVFDTDWLTEADFGDVGRVYVSVGYQAYDTLKIIAPNNVKLATGGFFQEFDVYKLENLGADYQTLLSESVEEFIIYFTKDEGYFTLTFYIAQDYWENELEGLGSIYIKGVKR